METLVRKRKQFGKNHQAVTCLYYPGQKNRVNRAHVAQARDLSSMHVPMFGLCACLIFFGQGSRWSVLANNSLYDQPARRIKAVQ